MSPRALARLLLMATSAGLAGCGYTLANTPDASLAPFTVRVAEATTPDAAAITAALEGAQRELSRAGLLSAQGDGTVLTIAVVRVDERSEGIVAGAGASATPSARGIRLTIAGRATAPASARASSRDSGEIEVAEIFASSGSAAPGILAREAAAQRAGRRLGERLVRRVLGEIDPGEP